MSAPHGEHDRLRSVFDAAAVAMAVLSPSGRILDVNRAATVLFGFREEELVDRDLVDLLRTPAAAPIMAAAVAELGRTKARVHFVAEVALAHGPGSLDVTLSPLLDASGAVSAILIEGIDVTARRHADAALRRSEARFRHILEAGWDIVSLQDARGAFIYWSGSTTRVHGFTPEELLAQSPGDRVHPDDLPGAKAALAGILQRPGATATFELRFLTKDERWIWLQSVAVNLLHDPSVQAVLTTTRDITARKQVELSLATAEQHLRQLGENLHDVLWILDPASMKLVYMSPAAAAVWGRANADSIRDFAAWFENIVPEDLERCRAAMARGLAGEPSEAEFRILLEGGGTRTLRAITFPVRDASGAVHRVVGTTRDVTAELHAEEEARAARELLERRVAERTGELHAANASLARAGRAKDEFLAAMSHEVRTPLNAVLGIAEALEEGVYGELGEAPRAALGRIGDRGRHLLDLLAAILDLANVAAGELAVALAPVSVDDVCRSSLREVEDEARAKRHAVSFGAPPLGLTVRADAGRLRQILVNLLRNAVKFTPPGGAVGLAASADPATSTVRFTIWDTGVGVAPADQGRMFEPFVQLDGRLSRGHGGAGIGLTLVRRLVELHGGTVDVESEPGRGSRFIVALPSGAPLEEPRATP